MFQFRSCPRCRGDVFLEDQGGLQDLVCLQCGYRRPLPQGALPPQGIRVEVVITGEGR
ncbi:hypothetical protein HRbin24_01314 [bacterium HR24]|jgi:Zn-finger nucleic acid-binding protein|nr:hypothetical protein HRbin24_01314 [bacterium HR24]